MLISGQNVQSLAHGEHVSCHHYDYNSYCMLPVGPALWQLRKEEGALLVL